jgi:hypothetical protein
MFDLLNRVCEKLPFDARSVQTGREILLHAREHVGDFIIDSVSKSITWAMMQRRNTSVSLAEMRFREKLITILM